MPTPQQPTKRQHPFGHAQMRLFKYILMHPGCTMAQIREDEFPDKTGSYVHNLLRENYSETEGMALLDRRDLGERLPSEFRIKNKEFFEFFDYKHYVLTGNLKQKLVQASFGFDQTAA